MQIGMLQSTRCSLAWLVSGKALCRNWMAVGAIPVPIFQRENISAAILKLRATPLFTIYPTKLPANTGFFSFRESQQKKPGYFYRIDRHARALKANGYAPVAIFFKDIPANLSLVGGSQFIFIWRAIWTNEIETLIEEAKTCNVPIIFDLDDLMIRPELATAEYIDAIRYDRRNPEGVRMHFDNIARVFRHATYGCASTEELAWQMRRVERQKPTFVLPNGFDEATYQKSRVSARKKGRQNDGLIRIGYASGSRTHQKDFTQCAPAIVRILMEHPETRLVLFKTRTLVTLDTSEFPELKEVSDQIEWRRLRQPRRLADRDRPV